MKQLTTLAVFAALAATAFDASAETKFWVLKPVPILRAAGGTGSPGPAPAEITLASALLPEGKLGKAYNFDLRTVTTIQGAGQDWGAVSWVLGNGTLPVGLSLANDGKLTGTPTAKTATSGSNFTVVGSYKSATGQQVYTIKVGEALLAATQIVSRGVVTCAITTLGGVKCWGYGEAGALGNNSSASSSVPVDVVGLTSGVAAITAGYSHTCALTTAGGAKCWGLNNSGQLGHGLTTFNSLVPVDVVGLSSGVATIVGGQNHTCAVTTAGAAKCWGSNTFGELGNGLKTASNLPVDVIGLNAGVASMAPGLYRTCAVTTAGGAKCWGRNNNGQLGDGSMADSLAPVDVVGLASGVSSIVSGSGHSCALTSSGGLKCWGANGNGQLGINSTAQSLVPADVVGLASGVKSMSSSTTHTCAVTTAGAVKCWGANGYGQLGNNSTTQSNVQVDAQGLSSGVASVQASHGHTCVLTSTGAAKCWGGNSDGQLGNNTSTNSFAPVEVVE